MILSLLDRLLGGRATRYAAAARLAAARLVLDPEKVDPTRYPTPAEWEAKRQWLEDSGWKAYTRHADSP